MDTKQSATLLCAAIDKDGEPYTTQIVAFISPGLPYFSIIGMPDTFLGGVRERIHTAMGAQGFTWPATRVTANIMPASRHKDGRAHELAVAASILCANGVLDKALFDHAALIGRLDDDGDWHSGGGASSASNTCPNSYAISLRRMCAPSSFPQQTRMSNPSTAYGSSAYPRWRT